MKRTTVTYYIEDTNLLKKKLFTWVQNSNSIVWLDSNENPNQDYELIAGIGKLDSLKTNYTNAFQELENFSNEKKDYLFGYLGYDLKNELEKLHSNNEDISEFKDLVFIQPEKIFKIKNNQIIFEYPLNLASEITTDYKEIQQEKNTDAVFQNHLDIKAKIPKEKYLQKVTDIQHEIHLGNVYEINFCQEFYAEKATIHPASTFKKLNNISKTPFACFVKIDKQYVLCASPERFLKKTKNNIISQPIKGTAKRDLTNHQNDTLLKDELTKNRKEQAENVMIVDLVRNDLSHIAKKGTVKVEELCKVYSFKQVHQMISTISCEAKDQYLFTDIIKACYPMGSMTGAPKIAAMELIEQYEESKRGIYSGAIGYITPEQDFDFNVVIRSIVYNQEKQTVSYSVGSAITTLSDPEKEYEECLVKANAMKLVLS